MNETNSTEESFYQMENSQTFMNPLSSLPCLQQ
jgi:hypothetical protein